MVHYFLLKHLQTIHKILKNYKFIDNQLESDICSLKLVEPMGTKYDSLVENTELSSAIASMLSEFALKQNSKRHNDSCCSESVVDETESIIHLAESKIWKQLNGICYKKSYKYKQKTVPMLLFQKKVDWRSQKVRHRQKNSNKQHRHKLKYYRPDLGAYLVLNNSVDLFEKDMDDLVKNLKLLSLNDVNSTFSEETEFKTVESYCMSLNCKRNAVDDDRCLREITIKTDCVLDKPLTGKEALAVNSIDAVDALPGDDDINSKNVTQSVVIYGKIADNLMSHNTNSGQISYDLVGNIKDDDKTVEGESRFTYEYINDDSHSDLSCIKQNCITVKDPENNMLKDNSEWDCIAVKEAENSMLKSNSNKCNVMPVKSQLKNLLSPCKSSFFISPVEIDSSEESDDDSHCQDEDGWTSNDEVTSDILHEDFFSSLKRNGIYLPNKHLPGPSDLDLKGYGKSIMVYPLSIDYEADSVCLSSSRSEKCYTEEEDDHIVFSNGCDKCTKEKKDEEETEIYKMSRLEIINHKWNQAYPYTAKADGQNDDIKCKKTVSNY